MLSFDTSVEMEGKTFTNWAGSFSCSPELYFEPSSLQEIMEILEMARSATKKVKLSAQGHSPSDIAMTDEYMINMNRFNNVIELDKEKCQVKVEAGITVDDLNKILELNGMALSNLPAIGDVSVGGLICTGTHGTGIKHGIIATQVVELELLTAQGEVLFCSPEENPEIFRAAQCSIGALGVIVTLTFQCEPQFKLLRKDTSSTLEECLSPMDNLIDSSEFFALYWYPYTEGAVMRQRDRTDKPVESSFNWFRDALIGYYFLELLYWICTFLPRFIPSVNRFIYNWCGSKERTDVANSDKLFQHPCLFKHDVTEWSIPRQQTASVLRELKTWLDANKDVRVHIPVVVRFVKGDDIMMSPANGRDSCFMNILMYRPYGKFVPYAKYWAAFEKLMYNAGGRPNWAKAHKLTGTDFKQLYPEFEKFCDIRKKLDPQGLFLNDYLQKVLFTNQQVPIS
ncbi:L-gulonolactone oxidase-like isoform X3 [Asterias amurensis]|uniref:L-gulonolactone oxidase-like isoform X3 n=1 Tax=Asterias amurensis TaxID=7602 RepID=UPI003AB22C76